MSIFSFSKGIVLAQHKEPAFSRPLIRFVNPQTETLSLDRQPVHDVSALTQDDIIEISKIAKIVDERDGKLLYRKLIRAKSKAVAVICDAIDDEPYVSSKINPMLKLRDEVIGGISLCLKVAGTDDVFIMAYKNITDVETRIPGYLDGYKISKLRGGYPARPQASLLTIRQGRKLTVGVGSLIHLYRAAAKNKKQSTVFITVAGNCIANPMNMEVSIGMTVQQVLDRCGLSETPHKVICGGPMTGISIMDTERTLVTYTTRAIIALAEDTGDHLYTCIGCGRCERICPAGLSPMYIYRFVESKYYPKLDRFDAHLCRGCGTCSYICPSRLNVSEAVQIAKGYTAEKSRTVIDDEEADDLEA